MPASSSPATMISRLTPFAPDDPEKGSGKRGKLLRVVIETPQGSRNKYDYDDELGLFKLGGVLPAGAVFPFDFGFVPSTLGGDGDPLDVLVLMDEAAFTGCLVEARLIGAIEALQTEQDDVTTSNHRLVAVAANARNHNEVRAFDDLSRNLLDEIEHFFVSYNQIKGKRFEPLGRVGAARAEELVEEGMRRFRAGRRRKAATKKRR